jgi:hypothetical protein
LRFSSSAFFSCSAFSRAISAIFSRSIASVFGGSAGCGGGGSGGFSGGFSTGFGGAGFGREATGFGAADGPTSSASMIGPGTLIGAAAFVHNRPTNITAMQARCTSSA